MATVLSLSHLQVLWVLLSQPNVPYIDNMLDIALNQVGHKV